jgi:hypothetical protein
LGEQDDAFAWLQRGVRPAGDEPVAVGDRTILQVAGRVSWSMRRPRAGESGLTVSSTIS